MARSNCLSANLIDSTGITSNSQLTGTIYPINIDGGSGATNLTYLRGDGTWVAPALQTINSLSSGKLLYYSAAGSATTLSSLSPTLPSVPVSDATGAFVLRTAAVDGSILIGSSSGSPVFAKITAGTGVTVNPTSFGLVLSGKPTTTVVTASSELMKWGQAYIANGSALVTLTLPTYAPLGSLLRIVGINANLWSIAQGAGQSIRLSSSSVTTTGTLGSVTSSGSYDSVTLICTQENLQWTALLTPLSAGLVVV